MVGGSLGVFALRAGLGLGPLFGPGAGSRSSLGRRKGGGCGAGKEVGMAGGGGSEVGGVCGEIPAASAGMTDLASAGVTEM